MINYELGLQRLERMLIGIGVARSSDTFATFSGLRTDLMANLDDERWMGGMMGPVEKMERKRVLRELDRLSLQHLELAFIDLCDIDRGLSRPVPPSPESSQERSTTVKTFEKAHALVIGVGDYPHDRFADLPATVRDACTIAGVLTDAARCGYAPANVQVLTGEQATAAGIRAALQTMAQSADSQSIVFVYFSGHGGRASVNGSWCTYLCPREADPDDLEHTAISGGEFSTLLAAIPAQKMLVILDACHAGGSADLKATDGTMVWKAGLPDDYYDALSRGSGRVVIASSKEGQYSYVRDEGDLSLFTWHLREALSGRAGVRGDGLIHVLDVFHYVNELVNEDEPDQTPMLKVKDLDLNFPIALDAGGKGIGAAPAVVDAVTIREQIVLDPIAGAKALGDYLATRPEWSAKRTEVDTRRSKLEEIQNSLDLFGPNDNDKAAKAREIFFLLKMCLELERG